MANPIEDNATKILITLFENNRKSDLQFDGEYLVNNTKLEPQEINDAIQFLDDRNLLDRVNFLGTKPFSFGYVSLNSRGRYIYHELLNSENEGKGKENKNNSQIVTNQPLAAGSPFGFTDLDWEFVQNESNKKGKLKVVLGYQFKSEFYDSNKLKENIHMEFKQAIEKYNSQSGKLKIELNFKSLAAGYGEHLFNQIARDIISSDIAVFETSDLNPNVMIEIGVALTWGKRVLPIKKLGCKSPPSDISGQTYVEYEENGSNFVSKSHEDDLFAMVERAIQKKIRT